MVPVAPSRSRATGLALLLALSGCAPASATATPDASTDAVDASDATDAALSDDVLPDASACAALIAACQAPSVVSTQAAWCHLLGHAGDEGRCLASLSSCLGTCAEEAGPADADAEGGDTPDARDAGDAADAPVTCASYCACMSLQCGSLAGYPFADDAACLARCGGFAPAALACYAYFCDDTRKWSAYPTLVQHECDHALGTYGVTAECPAL